MVGNRHTSSWSLSSSRVTQHVDYHDIVRSCLPSSQALSAHVGRSLSIPRLVGLPTRLMASRVGGRRGLRRADANGRSMRCVRTAEGRVHRALYRPVPHSKPSTRPAMPLMRSTTSAKLTSPRPVTLGMGLDGCSCTRYGSSVVPTSCGAALSDGRCSLVMDKWRVNVGCGSGRWNSRPVRVYSCENLPSVQCNMSCRSRVHLLKAERLDEILDVFPQTQAAHVHVYHGAHAQPFVLPPGERVRDVRQAHVRRLDFGGRSVAADSIADDRAQTQDPFLVRQDRCRVEVHLVVYRVGLGV